MTKTQIISALQSFISQRPGMEFANYGNVSAYRSELRGITKTLGEARLMLRYIERSDSITADDILNAAKSGRLSIAEKGDKVCIDYCTGQYWPTEYRRAVASLAASVLGAYWRDGMTGDNIGDRLRKTAKAEFGRGIAARFFN